MFSARPRRIARLAQALASVGVLSALIGCSGWDHAVRGSPFKDEPKIGRTTPNTSITPNRPASLYGFSSKARQIEQNLGVE